MTICYYFLTCILTHLHHISSFRNHSVSNDKINFHILIHFPVLAKQFLMHTAIKNSNLQLTVHVLEHNKKTTENVCYGSILFKIIYVIFTLA
jgi:hypothetical protein